MIEIVEKIGGLFSNYDSHCIDLSLDFFGKSLKEIVELEFSVEIFHLIRLYNSFIEKSLENIGENTDISWRRIAFRSINYLNLIWIISLEKNDSFLINQSEIALNSIFTIIIKKGFLELISTQIFFLMNLGIDSLDEDINVINKVLSNLEFFFSSIFTEYYDRYNRSRMVRTINY